MLDIDEVQAEEFSVFQLMQLFPNDIAAEKWFENVRWPDGKRCPKCNCGDIQEVYNRKPQPLRCRGCRYFFSVRKGTVMEGTNIGLQKWAFAIYMMVTSPKGVASTKVQKDLGLTLKTAWYQNQRLREGFANEKNEPRTIPDSPMTGTVEVDEAYIGGTDRWKHADKKLHGDWRAGREMVIGMKNRETNQVTAARLPSVTGDENRDIRAYVSARIEDGTLVFSDSHDAYRPLPMHASVEHGKGQYVDGDIHTNGMESFWAVVKRGYRGVYHHVSQKHLQRYVNEFAGRLNLRHLDTLGKMETLFRGTIGKRLKRKDLTAGRRAYR